MNVSMRSIPFPGRLVKGLKDCVERFTVHGSLMEYLTGLLGKYVDWAGNAYVSSNGLKNPV
jgi:hypothetical protein